MDSIQIVLLLKGVGKTLATLLKLVSPEQTLDLGPESCSSLASEAGMFLSPLLSKPFSPRA